MLLRSGVARGTSNLAGASRSYGTRPAAFGKLSDQSLPRSARDDLSASSSPDIDAAASAVRPFVRVSTRSAIRTASGLETMPDFGANASSPVADLECESTSADL